MSLLVAVLEHSGGKLPKPSLATISAALAAKNFHGYGRTAALLLGGPDVRAAAESAADYGLDEVVYVQSPRLEEYLALAFSKAAVQVLDQLHPSLVLAPASSFGKDLLPRLAHHLSAGQASDVIEFLPGGLFRRPMYAGNVIADVEIATERKAATVRQTAFDAPAKRPAKSPVREIAVTLEPVAGQEFVSFETVASERPELTEAEVVVSGGRAMKSAENFEKYIMPLADALGAAVGASRAAVDSGFAPNDWQVGQTGKVVAPRLYVAVGISGAIQHLAGMKDSKVIVAVNKDPDAPIFEVADYGLVADLFEAVPQLIEEIKKAKA